MNSTAVLIIMLCFPVFLLIAAVACFGRYSLEKKMNRTRSPQERVGTSGYLAAAISFAVIAVILAVLIISFYIAVNNAITYM